MCREDINMSSHESDINCASLPKMDRVACFYLYFSCRMVIDLYLFLFFFCHLFSSTCLKLVIHGQILLNHAQFKLWVALSALNSSTKLN